MAKMNKRELNETLSGLAEAHNTVIRLQNKLSEHCLEVYGVEPGDIDNDVYIDRVGGGCGLSTGMSAEEFDRSMRECIERREDD
ncbi:hypothetical protein ACEUAI_20165 [Aeromonas veronii]